MTLAAHAPAAFTAALKPQLKMLIDNIRSRIDANPELAARWRDRHARAVADARADAESWVAWSEDQITQSAVGWLLTSVFVRFCEDNTLLGAGKAWITGPTPELRRAAVDAEQQFYRENDDSSYREWLETAFDALRVNPATRALVNDHAAIAIAAPSSDAIQRLMTFWRQSDENEELVWSFRDPGFETRFLGDLYQNLSDHAQKKYALRQTPEFVEEFILDRTLEPALKNRPLKGFRLIDPTCGSGHFLLGAFDRLLELWTERAPGSNKRYLVDQALRAVHGVDLNPTAVAIARFRLIVAAMRASGDANLVHLPAYTINVAVGDSLLHDPAEQDQHAMDYQDQTFDPDQVVSGFCYETEDLTQLRSILELGSYDVVVGNPPYITVKDEALNRRYRKIFFHCTGTYALSVPFMERFFGLAKSGDHAGYVGLITSDSFMRRDFGVPLIEKFLPSKDLLEVINSEGAWIPGHNMDGTPTVILVGRNREPTSKTVRTVLSMGRREPRSVDPGKGPYWRSIVEYVDDEAGFKNEWISVSDLPRSALAKHPWSLAGGGADALMALINRSAAQVLRDRTVDKVGFASFPGAEDSFLGPSASLLRSGISSQHIRIAIVGKGVRDWCASGTESAFVPYTSDHMAILIDQSAGWYRRMWPFRATLSETHRETRKPWWNWYRWIDRRYRIDLSITFSSIESRNHFALDRGGRVFTQTAPVIKLPASATEDEHLGLLGVLNSSTACFWLGEQTQPKGGKAEYSWARTRNFNCKLVERYPLPKVLPLERARQLDALAQKLAAHEPDAAIAAHGPSRGTIETARSEYTRIRALMIVEQEELDWEVYRLYGLIDEDLTVPVGDAPGIALGERAFEIELARKVQDGEEDDAWFTEHRSTPIVGVPGHWPPTYRALVRNRLAALESNRHLQLLERPECKRRWETRKSWDSKLASALKMWLLDRLEVPSLWLTPQGTARPLSIGQLAELVQTDPRLAGFVDVLDLWVGHQDAPVTPALTKLLADQHVPYLSAYRYRESGIRKRREWERIWDLQRRVDDGLIDGSAIQAPPPEYKSEDFAAANYWTHRGKLDVSKERFISYPDAGSATDPTLLLGWAGWDHTQQGLALGLIFATRESEGVAMESLVPIVAGIAEVLPWVEQWHCGLDPQLGLDLAEYLEGQLQEKAAAVGWPVQELPNWRPIAPPNRREARKARP